MGGHTATAANTAGHFLAFEHERKNSIPMIGHLKDGLSIGVNWVLLCMGRKGEVLSRRVCGKGCVVHHGTYSVYLAKAWKGEF